MTYYTCGWQPSRVIICSIHRAPNMWDLLILTAGDENQGDLFRHQLVGLDWKEYCKEVRVEIDPPGIKTGQLIISLIANTFCMTSKQCLEAIMC